MKVSEEIDALRTMGFGPMRYLVLPRALALMLVMPLLTLLGDFVGMLGGLRRRRREPRPHRRRLPHRDAASALHVWDVFSGLVKSVVFALAIALIACQQGFATTGGAEGVGRRTTASVVSILFALILIDAGFTMFFHVVPPMSRRPLDPRSTDLTMGWGDVDPAEGRVSFDVERGEVFAILGGSGCGKSTLLRYLVGLETPLGGEIVDRRASGAPHLEVGRPPFGVMFQSGALFGSLTVGENVGARRSRSGPICRTTRSTRSCAPSCARRARRRRKTSSRPSSPAA